MRGAGGARSSSVSKDRRIGENGAIFAASSAASSAAGKPGKLGPQPVQQTQQVPRQSTPNQQKGWWELF